MKNILLPIDFSDNSWNAVSYAVQLFKNETCTFYLLNTYTPVVYHVEYVLASPAQYGIQDTVRENSLNGLEEFRTRIKTEFKNPKHTIEAISAFNTLIQEVEYQVEEKNIHYVIMGTQGATGAKEILFGSNTVHVLKSVKCPVIAVPGKFFFETPHEVLFPNDFEVAFRHRDLKPILEICSLYNTRVNILHISSGYDLTKFQEENKKFLEESFKNIAHLFHDVSFQTVEEGIANFQLKAKINLLVMINNKHSFFENLFFKNTIKQIGFHVNVPFLVIPLQT
ncbi:universal stress protein [Gaetbulibacter aestuarii]|uniref:Universal stress protein n=1 Tax=Gaetbulibacter aestuarii TaxID=1502358 RepID=A0ABW7MWZ5_9FLAO